jgi:HEAT repeat protein
LYAFRGRIGICWKITFDPLPPYISLKTNKMETKTYIKLDVDIGDFPDELVDFIPDLVDKRNYKARVTARKNIADLGKEVLPFIYQLLTSKDYFVRREAAKIIELLPDKGSISVLLNLLDDEESGIRWVAAEGLAKIGRDSIVPLLKALVKCNGTFYIQKGALHVFNTVFTPEEKEELRPLMLSLHNYLEFDAIASVEASKALRTVFAKK